MKGTPKPDFYRTNQRRVRPICCPPVTSYSSGCNPLQSPCVASCNPHCRSYARRRMQRKHFKGPRAVDRVSRARHRLSNSLNISGIGHPRKFVLPMFLASPSSPRVCATNTDRFVASIIVKKSTRFPIRNEARGTYSR